MYKGHRRKYKKWHTHLHHYTYKNKQQKKHKKSALRSGNDNKDPLLMLPELKQPFYDDAVYSSMVSVMCILAPKQPPTLTNIFTFIHSIEKKTKQIDKVIEKAQFQYLNPVAKKIQQRNLQFNSIL